MYVQSGRLSEWQHLQPSSMLHHIAYCYTCKCMHSNFPKIGEHGWCVARAFWVVLAVMLVVLRSAGGAV